MKNKTIQVPDGTTENAYIQPSYEAIGQPAHVVQDGWIAYLPSQNHARPSFEKEGRGFFKGHASRSASLKR